MEIFSSEAFYETQFGYLSRPTHRNTTWDAAKFEVCGHKYIDLSEYGYGMAMLNDCKYGFAVEGNTMRISLLRGATGPGVHSASDVRADADGVSQIRTRTRASTLSNLPCSRTRGISTIPRSRSSQQPSMLHSGYSTCQRPLSEPPQPTSEVPSASVARPV